MKNTSTKGTIKRRIIAVALSAISVTSFATASFMTASAATAAPYAVCSVRAANGIEEKTAYAALSSGLSSAISILAKTNPFTALIANSLIGSLKAVYEYNPSAPTTKDVLDTLKKLSDSINEKHEIEMTEINKVFLKGNIDSCLDNYRVIKGANKTVAATLSRIDDLDNCSIDLCREIVKITNDYSDFNASFARMTEYLDPDGTSEDSLMVKYMEYMKTQTSDATVIKENAEKFINLVAGQYLLAYMFKITGYAAQIRITKLENAEKSSDTEDEKKAKQLAIKEITVSRQSVVDSMTNTDVAPALKKVKSFLDDLKSLDTASVIINGNETHCYSIVDAWVQAVKSNGKAVIKLDKDIVANDFEKLSHTCVNASKFIKNGALYLENENSEITLDLNGHTLLNEKGEAVNINNCKSFKVISSADKKGTLGGLRAEGSRDNKITVDISNTVISGGSETGIYANHAVDKLTVNNCIIRNYTNSGIKLYDDSKYRYAEINNCVFENNSAEKGGAIHNDSFNATVNNCQFLNNKSSDNGGAIYYEGYYYHYMKKVYSIGEMTVNNSTFSGNSGKCGGAVYIGFENKNGKINSCSFTGNKAYSHGGAVCSTKNTEINFSNFRNNYASSDGGAVCYLTDISASIRNSEFYNNSCGSDGGAISVWAHTDADIYNCKIENNSCGGNGGGVYFGALSSPTAQHQLNTVTITNNTCGNEGGGIYCNTSTGAAGDVNLYRTVIIRDNHNNDGASSNARMICASGKKAVFYVRSTFDLNNSCIYVSSNKNDTAVVSLSSGRSESYKAQAEPFHADGGKLERGSIYNGTVYYYN